MKKLFTLIAFTFFVSYVAYAQEAPDNRTETYLEFKTGNKFLSKKILAQVDFGEGVDVLKDEQGKPMHFVSTVAALNYMNSKGWELVNSHVVVEDSGSSTYYIMRRKTKQE